MHKSLNATIVWIRNDFRLCDNEALVYAISLGNPIVPVFIFEDDSSLWSIGAASKWWLHYALIDFQKEIGSLGLNLIIKRGKSVETLLSDLIHEIHAKSIVWNRAYDSVGILRDAKVLKKLATLNVKVETFSGNILFEPGTIFNKSKKPFQIFTPFYNHVKDIPVAKSKGIDKKNIRGYPLTIASESVDDLKLLPKINRDKQLAANWTPSIKSGAKLLKKFVNEKIKEYPVNRDFPGEDGTSRLSPYLHFGQISPKQIYEALSVLPPSIRNPYYRQIIWREFAWHILFFFPQMESISFKEEFEKLKWYNNQDLLQRWQVGKTGYPIVDAGMRELLETGWMHNRVRMIVGSFLVKDLMIHWLEGAKWFWNTLVDADLANNTFGWQWVAGCGQDASPFFRIFNPVLQSQKFDPQGIYIKRFVPELKNVPIKFIHAPWTGKLADIGIQIGVHYPEPIVSHNAARINALRAYNQIKNLR